MEVICRHMKIFKHANHFEYHAVRNELHLVKNKRENSEKFVTNKFGNKMVIHTLTGWRYFIYTYTRCDVYCIRTGEPFWNENYRKQWKN